jgi:internalin A
VVVHHRDQVFISYSHKDKKWLTRLRDHLTPFVRNGLEVWDDTRIKPGSKWKAEIASALARAKVAVLLVSPHFLASEFIARQELPPLLDAANKDGLKILWIAVSASAYQETEIAGYQAAHDPSIALDRRSEPSYNKELVAICRTIKESITV